MLGIPKILLFDVDGVLIRPPAWYSDSLEASAYPGAKAAMDAFYHSPEYRRCLLGQEDPSLAIQPWLRRMGWKRGSLAYLEAQYAYEGGFLDSSILERVGRLRKAGIPCWLATDQDPRRRDYLLEELGLGRLFDGYFVSSLLHAQKAMPEFWTKVLARLGGGAGSLDPSAILFVDDLEGNLAMAATRGISTHRVAGPAGPEGLRSLLDTMIPQEGR